MSGTLLRKVKFLHIFTFPTIEKPKQALSVDLSVTLAEVFLFVFDEKTGEPNSIKLLTTTADISRSNIGSPLFQLFYRFKMARGRLYEMFCLLFTGKWVDQI